MRISRHQMYLEIARTASKRSTCARLNVGSVLIKDNHLISIGYNGPPSGAEHCQGNECPLSQSGGCTRSAHAEWNAINRAVERHQSGDTIYCTHSPCQRCAEAIRDHGVKTVIYEALYRDASPVEWLMGKGIIVLRHTPSGYLVNHADNTVSGL